MATSPTPVSPPDSSTNDPVRQRPQRRPDPVADAAVPTGNPSPAIPPPTQPRAPPSAPLQLRLRPCRIPTPKATVHYDSTPTSQPIGLSTKIFEIDALQSWMPTLSSASAPGLACVMSVSGLRFGWWRDLVTRRQLPLADGIDRRWGGSQRTARNPWFRHIRAIPHSTVSIND